jgi:hypothetical protein
MKEDEWKLEVHTIRIMETVAVRARHVTPVIPFTVSLWLNLILPVFVGTLFTLRVSYGFPVKPHTGQQSLDH